MSDATLIPTTPETSTEADAALTASQPAAAGAVWRPGRERAIPGGHALQIEYGQGSESGLAVAIVRVVADVQAMDANQAYQPIADALRETLAGSEEYARLVRLSSQEAEISQRKLTAADKLVRLAGERAKVAAQAAPGTGKALLKIDRDVARFKQDLAELSEEFSTITPLVQAATEAVRALLRASAAAASKRQYEETRAKREIVYGEALAELCKNTDALSRYAELDLTLSQRVAADRREAELSAALRASLVEQDAPKKPRAASAKTPPLTPPSPPRGEGSREAVPDAEPELLTELEVARLLRVSRETVERLTAEGDLPQPIRVGEFLRWRRAMLIAWMDAQQPETPPTAPGPLPPPLVRVSDDDPPLRPWPKCYGDIRDIH